jgi:hypothetical protein
LQYPSRAWKESVRHKQFYYITSQRVKETTGNIYLFMQSLPGTIEQKEAPCGPGWQQAARKKIIPAFWPTGIWEKDNPQVFDPDDIYYTNTTF